MDSHLTAWCEAFVKAQAKFPPITKNRQVNTGSYSYAYADLPSILDAVMPHLEAEGLAIAQSVVSENGQSGVTTHVYHESGHVESFGPVFLPSGNNAQSAGSAISYARRYSLCAALGIVADEDDDGRAASVPESDYVEPELSPEELAKRGTNKLKAEALELMGDADEARELFERAVINVGLDWEYPIPPDEQDGVREAMQKLAPNATE